MYDFGVVTRTLRLFGHRHVVDKEPLQLQRMRCGDCGDEIGPSTIIDHTGVLNTTLDRLPSVI
jgi:hypothetical protein